MALSRMPFLFSICLIWLTSVNASSEISGTRVKRTCSRKATAKKCIRKYADGLDDVQSGLGDSIRTHPGTVVAASKRSVVFGVGSGTTGTRSLGMALHKIITHFELEMKVSHWLHSPEENCDWLKSLMHILNVPQEQCQQELRKFDFTGIADTVGAILDYPTYELFINFFLAFPNARWILSTRPSDAWAEQRIADHAGTAWPLQEPCGMRVKNDTSKDVLSRAYLLTNDFIRCVVPQERLLEIDIFTQPTNNSMKTLREFVGFEEEDVDHEEFPHVSGNSEGKCKE